MQPARVRLPYGKEIIGLVDQRLGYGKMRVICSDRKIRICGIPGKYRKQLWIRAGTYVIIKPWDVQSDIRGDIIYKYSKYQAQILQDKGLLKGLEGG